MTTYDYDLVVVGGGSGGLSCAREAAKAGKKVCLLDFVKPSPQGSRWGLGGTCVNVGCIPKKLYHQASLLGQQVSDANQYGWKVPEKPEEHDWEKLVMGISDYIGSLNWGYRVDMRDNGVDYKNAFGVFVDEHTIEVTDRRNNVEKLTAETFVLAMGGRPTYPDVPGAKECCLTSDDIFSRFEAPGKTLCVGGSYVALECAGFLTGLGMDTTVMIRSIYLRGFDQQCANLLGDHMAAKGTKMLKKCVPTKFVKRDDGKIDVFYKPTAGGEEKSDTFDTVMLATGRRPCTSGIGLDKAGVAVLDNGYIATSDDDATNVPHIYAIGDLVEGYPELTPAAILEGRLLAQRLYTGSKTLFNAEHVATTVFTPMEYGCVGLAEEDAIAKYGEANIEVYHTHFHALEYSVAHRGENSNYCKLVCNKADNERVVGLHFIGDHAGEVTQGFALGIKLGATKADFDMLVGIHPTAAETLTTLHITKRSGKEAKRSGC